MQMYIFARSYTVFFSYTIRSITVMPKSVYLTHYTKKCKTILLLLVQRHSLKCNAVHTGLEVLEDCILLGFG